MEVDLKDFKLKDIILYVTYLITGTIFIIKIDSKVDRLDDSVKEFKIEKKEISLEQRQGNQIIQEELKSLRVMAEVNRSNINLNKADILLINMKLDKLLNKEQF